MGFIILLILYIIFAVIFDINVIIKIILFPLINFIFYKFNTKGMINLPTSQLNENFYYTLIKSSILFPITIFLYWTFNMANINKIFLIILLIICLIILIKFALKMNKIVIDIKHTYKAINKSGVIIKFRNEIYSSLREIEGIENQINFLENEISKLQEAGNDVFEEKKRFLEDELNKYIEEKQYREYRKITINEILYNIENNIFIETDIDKMLQEGEGFFVEIDNVEVYWKYRGYIQKMRDGILYISNRRLIIRTYEGTGDLIWLNDIFDIWGDDEYNLRIERVGDYIFLNLYKRIDIDIVFNCIKTLLKK